MRCAHRGRSTAIAGAAALAILALGLGGCSSLPNTQLVTLGAEYWDAQIGGSVQDGAELDVEDALDFDDERVWVYHAAGTVGPTRIEARYIDIGFSGLSTVVNGFTFAGASFDPGDIVASDLETSVLEIRSVSGLLGFSVVGIGIIAGADLLTIDTDLTDTANPLVSASSDYDEWIPVLGIAASAAIPVWKIGLFADFQASGMTESLSLDMFEGDYLTGFIRGGVDIDSGLKLGIGYRSMEADIDDGAEKIDIDLGGAYAFIELHF